MNEYFNFIEGTLSDAISDSDISITVTADTLPTLDTGDFFYAVLDYKKKDGQPEIIKVIDVNGDVLTVERGCYDTTPRSHNSAITFGHGVLAEDMSNIINDVTAAIEEWAAIADDTLGVLDPDTAIAAVTEVFVGIGVPQEFIDAMVPELEEVFQILLTEQPSDIHAAISNASQLIRLAIARTSILTFRLSLVDGQFGGVNDHLSTIDGQISDIESTLGNYGDIVTHDASEFALTGHDHTGVYDPAGSATAAQAAAVQRANHTGTQAQSTVTNLVTDLAAKVPTSRTLAGLDLSADISAGTLRTALALVIGTNVQAFSATLDLIAGLTPAANKIPYFTGSGAASLLNRDTDVTLAADSDTSIATQKAVKSHVNTRTPIHRGATSLTGVKLSTKSGLAGAAVVAGMAGSGRITYTPIFLPAGTYGSLSVRTTAAQASTWRLGVFNHATDDPTAPGTVAASAGTVDTSVTAGLLTVSMTLVVPYDDWYWCAAQVDAYTANPTVTIMAGLSGVDLLPFYGWPGQSASYLRGYAGYQDWSVSTGSLATARSITNNTSTGLAYAQDVPRFWIGA